jgi:hypothetical protein
MEFRWDSLDHTFVDGDLKAKIGVLGKLYRKAGTLVTRFSDLAFDGPQNGPHTGEIEGVLYDNLARSYLPSRYETQFEAPPGNYELHLILGDGRKFGRAIVPIDIPDFSAEQLAISSVVLFKRFRNAATAAAESAAVNLAPEYVPRVSQEMQVTPATDLNFKRGTPVATYFEVYAPVVAENPALKIEARIRVVSAKTGSSKDYPWFDLAPYRRGTSETFAVAQSPNTDGLPKGSYQLQVQARDSAGHVTAWQVSPFTLK